MNPFFRYFAIIAAALLIGLAIYFTGQIKPDSSKIFMGVGGDPRMKVCTGPLNGELAQPDALAKMGIDKPLIKSDNDKAAYRVSVLRPLGQESVSVTMVTPKTGVGKVTVTRWTNGALTKANAELDVPTAATIIFAFREAKIWDKEKPTIETLPRTGDASSVIEVRAPGADRCVTTRFDDERVRPLLATFVRRIGPLVAPVAIDGLKAPEFGAVPVVPNSNAAQGK